MEGHTDIRRAGQPALQIATPDPFDPNTWDTEPHQFRMYATEYADVACFVDEEDYMFFTGWLWILKRSRGPVGKLYFRRAKSTYYADGAGRDSTSTIYLHVEILTRAQGDPPTRRRIFADHINGDSLDNRRENLRWVTPRENRRNSRQ